uniref:Proton-coupled zinc antiporter SLC30A9, mitochondrial n=1 Tax=Haemonchus contortus TaxID=6289 RepID=A0A6F7PH28_HAECO|nr:Cation efflux protein domain containing protein [Haemonchus contortus]
MSSLVFHLPATILHTHAKSSFGRRIPSLARVLVGYASASSGSSPPGQRSRSKKRLFRIALPSKKSRSYENDKIDKLRAMAEFGLREEDFRDLPAEPVPVKSGSYPLRSRHLYVLTDVYHKAIQVHGSPEALDAHRRPLIAMRKELTDAERMRMRMRVETTTSVSKGADRVVAIAFTLNVCDAAFKYAAAYLTGSKSLFAEAIHSTMDTCNQMILLMGIRYSARNPDNLFPYGYGNMRYVTSLISGCGIMAFGCGLSIYHGVSGLLHPAELEPLNYAYYALFMSLCFQGTSAITAYREVRHKAKRAGLSILNYVRTSADPSLNVVLLEDTAAVSGVAIALCAVSLSSILASPIPDSIGSIMIGCLLGTVASFIIRTNAAHLVGRSLPKRITDDIVCRLSNDPVIRSVHDVKATALGVEQSRFKAELDFNGREITRAYLNQNVHMPSLLKEVQEMKDEKELGAFMETHGEKIIDRLGDEIDRIEKEITKKHPDIQHVDLEAL